MDEQPTERMVKNTGAERKAGKILSGAHRCTLEIKECPKELLDRFVRYARTHWYGKQYVALKALLDSAEYLQSQTTLENRLSYVQNLAETNDHILSRMLKPDTPEPEPETQKEKKTRETWGGNKDGKA